MKKEHAIWFLVGVAAGLVFSPQLRRLPLVSKIPTV